MTSDTFVANSFINRKKPVATAIIYNNDDIDLFNIYLEFVIYHIKSDIESYRKVLIAVPDHEVRHALSSMATKKENMHDSLISCRSSDFSDMFTLAFDSSDQSASIDFYIDTYFNPFQNVIDAFHFAYRKEYENLKLFEKAGLSSRLNDDILKLLENTVEHQRQYILHLDAMFSEIINTGISETGYYCSAKNNSVHKECSLPLYFPPIGES